MTIEARFYTTGFPQIQIEALGAHALLKEIPGVQNQLFAPKNQILQALSRQYARGSDGPAVQAKIKEQLSFARYNIDQVKRLSGELNLRHDANKVAELKQYMVWSVGCLTSAMQHLAITNRTEDIENRGQGEGDWTISSVVQQYYGRQADHEGFYSIIRADNGKSNNTVRAGDVLKVGAQIDAAARQEFNSQAGVLLREMETVLASLRNYDR